MKPSQRFESLAKYYAERAGLPFDLVWRQIDAESSYNPRAVSHAGAMGLLQLMPQTAKMLGCTEPFNPDENLKAGTTYLASIVADVRIRGGGQFPTDDIHRIALAGYNCGPGYCYVALKSMREAGAAQTWEEFKSWLPKATVKGRTPFAKDAISYAEKIVPLAAV